VGTRGKQSLGQSKVKVVIPVVAKTSGKDWWLRQVANTSASVPKTLKVKVHLHHLCPRSDKSGYIRGDAFRSSLRSWNDAQTMNFRPHQRTYPFRVSMSLSKSSEFSSSSPADPDKSV